MSNDNTLLPPPQSRNEALLTGILNAVSMPSGEEIAEAVGDWLNAHVSPETGYVIDNSLTVEGAAADAKTVGDNISDLESQVDDLELQTVGLKTGNLFNGYTSGYYWKSDGTKASSSSFCAAEPIDVTDYYSITYSGIGEPGSSPVCLWLDSNDDIIYYFSPKENGESLVVPQGAASIKFSVRSTNISGFSVCGITHNVINGIESDIQDIYGKSHDASNISAFVNGTITSSGDLNQSTTYKYRISTPTKLTALHDIDFYIADGFRMYLYIYGNTPSEYDRGWHTGSVTIKAGSVYRFTIGRVTEVTSEKADIALFCSKVTYHNSYSLNTFGKINDIIAFVSYGVTWDWWITCNSIDTFGNAYIGYVDTDGYAGIIRRQPDGVMQYKRLEKVNNDDDHNACATIVLDDGRILVIGSYGHTTNNHIICWRSVNPYSIDEMEELSFDLSQTGGYTYKTCYSQVIKYDGKLFDFMRFGSSSGGEYTYGFACLISTDNGSTWTPYKVFNGTDAYNSISQCTDDDKFAKIIVAINPASGGNTFRGCYIDLSTYAIYDLSDTQIGTMVPLNNGPITDSSCAHKDDMTALVPQTQSGLMGRLFFTAPTPKTNTIFLYATALDTAGTDFKYKRYADGTITELGNSGVGFGNVHYISGACFGKDIDTIYYSKATTAIADGPHELHKVKVSNNAVSADEIITEASMCIIRPLFIGNGELATVVGHYNDQNSDGTYNGSFTSWELKPMFTRA